MAHDVFISYSSKDKRIAQEVCAVLEKEGIPIWIAPRDILPGQDWGESIIDAINACKLMVIVFTASSNDSKQVLREVERAVAKGINIIPFRTENLLPSKSMEYFLSSTHWLDAYDPPLERHFSSLTETINLLLKQTTGVSGRSGTAAQKIKAAKEGDLEAQNSLGLMLENGADVARDEAEAIQWFTKAAERGFAEAQYNLARMRENAGDLVSAFQWYSRAAQQGMQEASRRLEHWQGGEESLEGEPERLQGENFQGASEAGSRLSKSGQDVIGLADGFVIKPGRKMSRTILFAGIGALVCIGLVALGILDLLRKPKLLSLAEASGLYEKAKLGEAKARNALQEAAAKGNSEAQFYIGRTYDNGIGAERNEKEAVSWYRKAADKGNAGAQLKLGRMYEVGIGVNRDPKEAVHWYRKAAEQGAPSAQMKLADFYQAGEAIAKDDSQAAGWYRKAAEQGNASAQFKLAKMYEEGRGAPKENNETLYWYRKAAAQHYYYARQALLRLSPEAPAK